LDAISPFTASGSGGRHPTGSSFGDGAPYGRRVEMAEDFAKAVPGDDSEAIQKPPFCANRDLDFRIPQQCTHTCHKGLGHLLVGA